MWRLRVEAKHPYSDLQQELFKLLPQNGDRVGTKDLLLAKLRQGVWDVRRPRQIVGMTMLRLKERIRLNKEPFVLCKTTGPRSQQTQYWLEARPQRTHQSSNVGSTRISLLD